MVSRYMLNNKTWDVLERVYPVLKDTDFTTQQVANIMGIPGKATGSTLGSMVTRNVIERCNGEKRCHHPGRGPSTQWRFTAPFKVWYEKYLEGERAANPQS